MSLLKKMSSCFHFDLKCCSRLSILTIPILSGKQNLPAISNSERRSHEILLFHAETMEVLLFDVLFDEDKKEKAEPHGTNGVQRRGTGDEDDS